MALQPLDTARFDELYSLYANDVLRMSYCYVGDHQKAEDICQNVFVKLYLHGREIAPGKEKPWLLRVAVNACRDVWRSAWVRRVTLGSPLLEIMPEKNGEIDRLADKEALVQAVHALPAQFREVILLFYYQGFGISEIAQILSLPEGTVSSRLSRGRTKLEALLKEANRDA